MIFKVSKYPVWTMRLSDETRARWSERAEAEQLSLPEFVRRCVEDVIEGRVGSPAGWIPGEFNDGADLYPQASDHPGRMTAHGAAAAFKKDVSDVRRDPSYRATDDTVLPLTLEQEQRRLAAPLRKSQLELEAEEMDRQQPRPSPFSKRGD